MKLSLDFGSLSDAERDDLAARLLVQAEVCGLAVALPERTRPYTVAEAAKELNVSVGTVYNLIKAERLDLVLEVSKKLVTVVSLRAVREGVR